MENSNFDETLADLENDFSEKFNIVEQEDDAKSSKAAIIIGLMENAELFCDLAGEPYVTFENDGHKETWQINSKHFEDWLSARYWEKHNKVASRCSLQDALVTIGGKAKFGGNRQKVYLRVAKVSDAIYIDLGSEFWEVIEVKASGWAILNNSPVKFVRTDNMQALPVPKEGGNIDDLWQFLNIPKEARGLVLAFLLECFRVDTPFVILVLHGLQGCAKSTTQEIIRMLLDPANSNLRCAPKKSDDLLVAAANNWMVSFNNVSHLSDTLQDELCCASTGGGIGSRQLYTNSKESVVDIQRPVIMNGIDNFVTAQDLIDRCIIVELPVITNDNRKTEQEIFAAFAQESSNIFGALLDILALTLKELPNVKLDNKPRMADFAILGTAVEKALNWEPGSFLQAYQNNRKENILTAMEHSPVILAITKFMQSRQRYEGTFADLFSLLSDYKPVAGGWPQSPKGLASQIKRHLHALKLVGINVEFSERRENGYHVWLGNDVQYVQDVQAGDIIKACAPEHY